MGRMWKKIWNVFTAVTVALVVILAVLLVGVRVTGLKVYTVLSGSMEPEYPTGAVIYVKEAETSELKVGQAITFKMSGGSVATHRIIEVISGPEAPDSLRFRTKGDANDVADGSLVRSVDVIGTPVFTIPYLGYFAAYIQKPPGLYFAVAASIVLIILMVMTENISDSRKNK